MRLARKDSELATGTLLKYELGSPENSSISKSFYEGAVRAPVTCLSAPVCCPKRACLWVTWIIRVL